MTCRAAAANKPRCQACCSVTRRRPRMTQSQVTGKSRASGGEAGSPPRSSGNGGSRERARQVGSRDRPGRRFLRRPARRGSRGACPVEGPTRAGHLWGCVSWTSPGDRREGDPRTGRESAAGAKTRVGGRDGAGSADFRGRGGSSAPGTVEGPEESVGEEPGPQRAASPGHREDRPLRELPPRPHWPGPPIHLHTFFSVGGPLFPSTRR